MCSPSFRATACWLSLSLAACAPDATGGGVPVTELSDGDATGSAASGFYAFETVTTSCAGKCSLAFGDISISVCEVGDRVGATATVVQTEGHLRIDSDDSDYVSRLEGGIDADGSFDVGGERTQGGTAITSSIRALGAISNTSVVNAGLTGTVQGHIHGDYEGERIDCRLVAELTGERESLPEAP
jgi:hypothetical protein